MRNLTPYKTPLNWSQTNFAGTIRFDTPTGDGLYYFLYPMLYLKVSLKTSAALVPKL